MPRLIIEDLDIHSVAKGRNAHAPPGSLRILWIVVILVFRAHLQHRLPRAPRHVSCHGTPQRVDQWSAYHAAVRNTI